MTNNRNEALLEVVRQGLEISGAKSTKDILGNRADYLGVSDLAKYSECPRAALLSKLIPQNTSLSKLLTLQRGHWFEQGLSECFSSLGLKFMPQLEISIVHGEVPIKAHLDFTLVWNDPHPAVRIVEVKSLSKLPEQPYTSHCFQTQAQVNLLSRYWNEPVFSLRDASGAIVSEKFTFPQICRQNLGMTLPDEPDHISVESWLLCLTMREAASFGPYVYQPQKLEELLSLAEECWTQYGLLRHGALDDKALPYSLGFNPLCSYCEFNADCPKFQIGSTQNQWEDTLLRHENLKKQREALDAEIKDIEASLKQAHQNWGSNDWIESGGYRFRVTNSVGRRTLDKNSLSNDLVSIFCAKGITGIDVDELFRRNEKIGGPSSRLIIMPIN